jgi:DNA-binding IclR family transcriptional regulator
MSKRAPPKKAYDQNAEFCHCVRGPETSATARALAILRAVSATGISVSVVDLALEFGMPKQTVHRLMHVLEYIGYVQREPGSKRFIAGHMQTAMAVATLINSPRRAERRSILQSLVDEVRESCNITALAGGSLVLIESVEGPRPLGIQFQPGAHAPLHCTASGKLFLSTMSAHNRRRLLATVPLKRFTERTVVDRLSIEKDLRQIRVTQFGLEQGEFLEGMVGVAVPVFDSKGRMCATVSTQAPAERVDPGKILTFVSALTRVSSKISTALDPRAF